MFLEKGVKVIRSSSEILALIKSCDNTTTSNEPKVVQPVGHSIKNYCTPLLPSPENVHRKKLKPLGIKRIIKSNVTQVVKSEDQKEIKLVVTEPSNNLKTKKLVTLLITMNLMFFVM